ncbi:MAG: hypothetical protein KGL39_12135 [Patescibacteria group bacterium]|nr:hypothetical protein [Patescibacteria group bacterium]
MKAWNGAELKPCKDCGADDWKQLDDIDHDDGTCEVFKCGGCQRTIHIELPD